MVWFMIAGLMVCYNNTDGINKCEIKSQESKGS